MTLCVFVISFATFCIAHLICGPGHLFLARRDKGKTSTSRLKPKKVFDDENNCYAIELRIVVAFGAEIARVAYQVQMLVRSQVEQMTGNRVKRVDVFIEGVKVVDQPQSGETEDQEAELWRETPHTD